MEKIIKKRMSILMIFFLVLVFASCSSKSNKELKAVDGPVTPPAEEPVTFHDLFSMEPGKTVPLSSYAGGIDPVGTSLVNDFDGDGITNDRETIGNVWVADYPVISVNIDPSVYMSIEVDSTTNNTVKTIDSSIDSSDVESVSDNSSDASHKEELNLRTVQYTDQFNIASSSENENETNVNVSTGVTVFGCGGNLSVGVDTRAKNAMSQSYGETKTKWQNIPFKDNLDKNDWSVKRKEASEKSRNLRRELRAEGVTNDQIRPNAGIVRATLSISNSSINMPARITNILCSLMFEKNDGTLIPIKSFYLRNDDYTNFGIDIGGGETASGYVIELNGLNTNEVKNAIVNGYNPKIFIVDYEMTHVQDSIYKKALSPDFSGDNLKMIQENAKGRTSGIKFVGPGMREFFRVAAFDTDANESRTTQSGEIIKISPGVSLKKALNRIGYSGYSFEYAYYLVDFSELNNIPKMCFYGIKSVNGIKNKIPIKEIMTSKYGFQVNVVKPVSEWTQDEKDTFRFWSVYAKGRYFAFTEDSKQGNELLWLDDAKTIPILKGVDSTIWPGDHYDVVCMDFWEYINEKRSFGNNPFETLETLRYNTRWNLNQLGEKPFDPDIKSRFLGQTLPGETIELRFKVASNLNLNPQFGTPQNYLENSVVVGKSYSQFTYDYKQIDRKLTFDEAVDFEISFGLGGEYNDWINLNPLRSPFSKYYPVYTTGNYINNNMIEYGWDYMNQEFIVRMTIPNVDDLAGIFENEPVGIYLRPVQNTAFRESIWPLQASQTTKFRGVLGEKFVKQNNKLIVKYFTGNIQIGDLLYCNTGKGIETFTVQSQNVVNRTAEITVNKMLDYDINSSALIYGSSLALTTQELFLLVDDNFENQWYTNFYNKFWPSNLNRWYWEITDGSLPLMQSNTFSAFTPVKSLGFNANYIVGNWIGNNNYGYPTCNKWADASFFNNYFSSLDLLMPKVGNFDMRLYSNAGLSVPPSHGLLNVIVAPLIERDYEVKARIIE